MDDDGGRGDEAAEAGDEGDDGDEPRGGEVGGVEAGEGGADLGEGEGGGEEEGAEGEEEGGHFSREVGRVGVVGGLVLGGCACLLLDSGGGVYGVLESEESEQKSSVEDGVDLSGPKEARERRKCPA